MIQAAPVALTDKNLRVFVVLLTIHTSLVIASNAAGSKLIALPLGLAASATVISYMLSFVLLGSIAELFGRALARLVVNVGLAAVALSVTFFELAIRLPAAAFWMHQPEFEQVLGSTPRLLAGGWTAYLVGQHLDVWGFFRLKRTRLGGEFLWLRSWGGTLLGQLIDTVIFITIAFAGTAPLLPAIAGQYLVKLVVASLTAPLIYVAVGWGRAAMARTER
ncbi:MAG TPA: queuosine precursor transporter [Stellaceae bacterium]|nr:queuosine precursor transporter [Stellaceae bacterium]